MKISVITARFSVSGVPLAQIRLANAWQKLGHAVDCVFGSLGSRNTQFDDGLNVVDLSVGRTALMLPALMSYFRRKKPDLVFSAEDHLNTIVLLAAILTGSAAKICCSSRVTPFDTYSGTCLSKRWFLKWIMRCVMWRADLLTCVSKDMVGQYQTVFGNTRHVWVYNIVDARNSAARILEPVQHEWFADPSVQVVIGAGSLEHWKGFSDLIRAMTRVPGTARLMILGEGSQRAELERLIESEGLSSRVQLLGGVSNPLKYFRHSDVFALASHVEGMPNVLVEAMMCGCTPISTDCPTGPRELLSRVPFEPLVAVGDWRALGRAISNALSNPVDSETLEDVVRAFSESAVLDRYLQLLDMCAVGSTAPKKPVRDSVGSG